MARPERNNVDYFPFDCQEGKKMFYIEEIHGNDGFATFVKILRELARKDYHYLDLSEPAEVMYLAAKCKVNDETLKKIIEDLVKLDKFDKELWEKKQVIWCQDFTDSVRDAYKKRSNECLTREELVDRLGGLGGKKRSKRTPQPDKKEEETEALIMPWESDAFATAWAGWIHYKRVEHRDTYKTIKSEQMALNGLERMAKGDEDKARLIILKAMENHWKGLFPLKKGDFEDQDQGENDHLHDIKNRL